MLDAVARRIDAPLHLVAHSLGGAVTLTTALANVADTKSIATFEASPVCFLRDRGATFEEILAFSDNFEAGEHNAARQIIDF